MNSLLPFLMAGDPSLDVLPRLLSEARALGIEALELGLPHSDPIADGPVLQAAAHRAIASGATPIRVLEALAGITDSPDLILFTYLNPLLQIGAERLKTLLRPTPGEGAAGGGPALRGGARVRGGAAGGGLSHGAAPGAHHHPGAGPADFGERPDPGPGALRPALRLCGGPAGRHGRRAGADLAPVRERMAGLGTFTARPLAVGFGLSDAASLAAVRAMGATPVIGSALVRELAGGKSLAACLAQLL